VEQAHGRQIDRYIFGHPRGKYDSVTKFYVHFKHLMDGGAEPCQCVKCSVPAPKPKATPAEKRAPVAKRAPADIQSEWVEYDEPNPAQKYIELFRAMMEDPSRCRSSLFSVDENAGWQYELFNVHINRPAETSQVSHLPRKNELILFYEELLPLRVQESTQMIKLYDEKACHFLSVPKWRAGRVLGVSTDHQEFFDGRSNRHQQSSDVDPKFVLIELLPDDEETWARPKELRVPTTSTRPLSLLQELLHGLDQAEWDPSLMQAITLMNRMSLVQPYAFTMLTQETIDGDEPQKAAAEFRCDGIWIGAEKIVEGDVVRLLPTVEGNGVEEVLHITQISYIVEARKHGVFDGAPFLRGQIYTNNPPNPSAKPVVSIMDSEESIAARRLPPSVIGYNWYKSKPGNPTRTVPATRILGRLYQRKVLEQFVYSDDVSIGTDFVVEARRWAMSSGGDDFGTHGWLWMPIEDAEDANIYFGALRSGIDGKLHESHKAVRNGKRPRSAYDDSRSASSDQGSNGENVAAAMEKMSVVSGWDNQSETGEDEAGEFIRMALARTSEESDEDNAIPKRPRFEM
jgi:hypothetical protein